MIKNVRFVSVEFLMLAVEVYVNGLALVENREAVGWKGTLSSTSHGSCKVLSIRHVTTRIPLLRFQELLLRLNLFLHAGNLALLET